MEKWLWQFKPFSQLFFIWTFFIWTFMKIKISKGVYKGVWRYNYCTEAIDTAKNGGMSKSMVFRLLVKGNINMYVFMYIFIYSRIIKIKIKIYNNMQLKYIKQIKPQHKVKPSHNWTDQIRGRSQRSLTLFIPLERAHVTFAFQTQPVVHIILKFLIIRFLFDFARQIIPNVGS